MHSERKGIVIIGNGCASAECVRALRENGYRGKLSLLNDTSWSIFNPMLITYYLSEKISFDGLFPYGRGQDFYKRYGVDTYFESPALAIFPEQKVVYAKSGIELQYDQCLIATGARPIFPPIQGIPLERVFTIRTVEDTIRLKNALGHHPKKVFILGASLIGIKVAEVFHNKGIEVYLADISPHILPLNAHPECARRIEEHLLKRGVLLRLGAELVELKETERGIRASFKDRSQIETDLLVICIGVKANTEFIDQTKVAMDRGILIDEYMRTSVPGLYAAGDVTQGNTLLGGRPQMIGLFSHARLQGRTAGKNMAGKIVSLPGSIPHHINHFMGIDFVSIGDINGYDRMEIRSNGERFIQLFWNGQWLTGANILGSYQESGVIKNGLVRGLLQKRNPISERTPFIQNQLLKEILGEVGAT